MLVEWLRRNVAEFATQLDKFMGTSGPIVRPDRSCSVGMSECSTAASAVAVAAACEQQDEENDDENRPHGSSFHRSLNSCSIIGLMATRAVGHSEDRSAGRPVGVLEQTQKSGWLPGSVDKGDRSASRLHAEADGDQGAVSGAVQERQLGHVDDHCSATSFDTRPHELITAGEIQLATGVDHRAAIFVRHGDYEHGVLHIAGLRQRWVLTTGNWAAGSDHGDSSDETQPRVRGCVVGWQNLTSPHSMVRVRCREEGPKGTRRSMLRAVDIGCWSAGPARGDERP
jgi:hypothetical protein